MPGCASTQKAAVAVLAAAALALVCAAPASARIIEIGQTPAADRADLPGQPVPGRLAHDRLPGQGRRRSAGSYIVPADGKIVAWTITLGTPDKRQIKFFNEQLRRRAVGRPDGAPPRHERCSTASIGRSADPEARSRTSGRRCSSRSAARSTVKKGYVVALTVPTWAPALALGWATTRSWRASRAEGRLRRARDADGAVDARATLAQYRCLYRRRG